MVEYRRETASIDEIIDALAPCLALVAPTGFTAADRQEWLAAAAVTLAERSLSTEVLKDACKAARQDEACDHPAKIMPAIIRYLGPAEPSYTPPLTATNTNSRAQIQFEEFTAALRSGAVPQAQIDDKPEQWRRVLVERGLLRRLDDGTFIQRLKSLPA